MNLINQRRSTLFSNTTTIQFSIPKSGLAVLGIYNLIGLKISSLHDCIADEDQVYEVETVEANLNDGVYLINLTTKIQVLNQKLIIINK